MITLVAILQALLFTLLGMLASSLLAFLIIKLRKWCLLRRSIFHPTLSPSPFPKSKALTLEQYIQQIDSIRYVDQWPNTERVIEVVEVVPSTKAMSSIETGVDRSLEKTIQKGMGKREGKGMGEKIEIQDKLNKTLPA